MARANFAYTHPSFMGNPFGPEILAEIKEAQVRRDLRERIKYLRRQKLIKMQQEGDRIVCKMTKEGQARALYQKIRYQDVLLTEDLCTVVVFDIPEDTKVTRWWLRKRLKEFGFELHQKSVWVSQKDVAEKLSSYIRVIGIEKWVTVFRARIIKTNGVK